MFGVAWYYIALVVIGIVLLTVAIVMKKNS